MNIDPQATEALRPLLVKADALRLARDGEAEKVSLAAAASLRVRRQIADFDARLEQLSNVRIDVKADRLAQIIAGNPVRQAEGPEIERRAAEARQLKAHRLQAVEDLTALDTHLSGLKSAVASLDAQIARLEAEFYIGLGDAVLAAYKRSAIAFVADNVPYLRSIAHRVQTVTGQEPAWGARAMFWGALTVQWRAEEPTQVTPAHPMVHEAVQVWPRPTANLLSGQPIVSDALIDDLVQRIRLPAPALADGMDR